MSSPYQIARSQLEAAFAAAAGAGIDPERFGKALLSELLQRLRRHRSAEDLRGEVAFELDNLDGDQEYPFMRP